MLQFIRSKKLLLWVMMVVIVAIVVLATTIIYEKKEHAGMPAMVNAATDKKTIWQAPDSNTISHTHKGGLIRYGKRLVASTSYYLGPKGTIAAISNGMNCQNCHLDAGTRLFGNNYSAVFSTYPQFRERSGTVENIYKRVNDCMERSLNGKSLDTGSREMQAFSAYISWLGQNVPRNVKPAGAGIADIPFLDRAADPAKGHVVYIQQCQRCHGIHGEGLRTADSMYYTYPPLWGPHSYTTGAGLFRISRFAGYVKYNMPFGSLHNAPQLTDKEAWDVAAFVNSQPRPERKFNKDWPDISGKPVDHPFGPYADSFSEEQHKYGPFGPIRLAKQQAGRHNKKS